MASAEIQCPTRLHDGVHEVKVDRGGKEFIFCDFAKSNFTFRSEAARRWLESQNGGIRANPRRIRKEKETEEDDFLSDDVSPEDTQENPQDTDEDVRETKLREIEENKLRIEMWERLNRGD